MDDTLVVKAVNAEIARAESFLNARISYERKLAYDYYYGRLFGNEKEGRSQIIAADVAQAVDSAVPAIVEIFVSGDKAVEFTPRNKEDVDSAEQATLSANYVFFTQNNGYALAHDFIKDGLLQKTGVFKWKWDTSCAMCEKTYRGLDDQTFQVLDSNLEASGAEMVAHTEYPAPSTGMAMGQADPGPTSQGQPSGAMPGTLHDVTVRIKKESGKVRILVPPPEEVLISPDSMTLEVMDMPFIAHTPLLTASDLREMGIEQSVIDTLPKGDDKPNDQEKQARKDRTDSAAMLEEEHDDIYRYNECYIRLDVDDDGIAELRKICLVGDTILHNEPTDHIPMAIWTPKVMPHEVVGVSLADDVMDLQLLKSTIWRMTMDSWYQSVYPRMFVQGDVNMDDVLTLKPGGAIRGGVNSNLTPITVPFSGQSGFQMLEYADQEKDSRVGFSAMGPGMDPDSINKTATFVREVSNQTNARAKLIARNAAEFGFKPLFKGITYLLSKHQQQALMVRLNNKFVPVDPETWNKEYDMSCNVGLGVGNKDQQLMHLQSLSQDIAAVGQSPYGSILLDAQKVYNLIEKKANLAGFKDVSVFLKDPTGPDGQVAQPQQQPPEAVQVAQVKAQADQQKTQAQLQAEQQIQANTMQVDQAREAAQAQADMAVAQHDAQMKMQLERYKIDTQAEFERFKAQLDAHTELQKAALMAQVQANRPQPGA